MLLFLVSPPLLGWVKLVPEETRLVLGLTAKQSESEPQFMVQPPDPSPVYFQDLSVPWGGLPVGVSGSCRFKGYPLRGTFI